MLCFTAFVSQTFPELKKLLICLLLWMHAKALLEVAHVLLKFNHFIFFFLKRMKQESSD
jgi:hypothetical protein